MSYIRKIISLKSLKLISAGKSAALIITLAPWSWFTQWKDTKLKHRGDDYEALKMRLAHQMWRQCDQLFPQLEDKVSPYIYLYNGFVTCKTLKTRLAH